MAEPSGSPEQPAPDRSGAAEEHRRELGRPSSALDYPKFVAYLIAAFVSNAGTWMQNLTVPYVLYQRTHSAVWVGMAGFVVYFPSLLVSPHAGAIADRSERQRVMLFTQSFMALTAVVLWVMWLTGVQSPWAIVGVVALGAVATGYNVPANQSLLTDLVPREALLSAVSLNGAQFNAGRAVGPALAGLVLAALGPSWAFALNAVSFGGLIGVLALIHIPSQGIRPDDRPPVMASYLQGVRGLWADPGMRLAYLLYVALAALGQPALQLIPVFAKKVFDVGAVGVGLLTASFGVGAVFGAVLLTWWRDVRRSRLVRWSYPFLGLGVTLFAISPNMAMAMAVLFPAGMANLVAAAGCNTTVHLRVPPAIRGRVMGFYLLGFTAAFPLSALIQGWLADLIGPQATVAISGGLLMTVGAILLLKPSLPLSMDGNIAVD